MIAMFGIVAVAGVADLQRHRGRACDRLNAWGTCGPDDRDRERRVGFARVLASSPAAAGRKRGADAYEQDGD